MDFQRSQPAAATPSSPPPAPSLPAPLPAGAKGTVPGSNVFPEASPPQRISYPAAEIELPVLPLTPSPKELDAGLLVPPVTRDAYWLTPYGQPGSGSRNTTYIVAHSWEDAEAPFNRLSSHSAPGDALSISTATGTVRYRVESITTHDKNTLRNSDVWRIVPGRLVLISCYTEDLWGKNVIVTAVPEH